MSAEGNSTPVPESERPPSDVPPNRSNRRSFLGQLGVAATVATGALAGAGGAAAKQAGEPHCPCPILPSDVTNSRVIRAFTLRVDEAKGDANIPVAVNTTNGDEARYADKCATFAKGLPHDSFGRVDLSAFQTFKTALNNGKFADFEKIIMGGTRTLNGPQGGLAFDLEGADAVQFGRPIVPPAPTMASDLNATELLELYWASLLRDVAFSEYASNPLAQQAATELSSQPSYRGPRNGHGEVSPHLLFRGPFPGETLGPYLSQFFLIPTDLGAQPIGQQQLTYLPNIDYMANFPDWLTVQTGNYTGLADQIDPQLRYRRCGRDIAAFTHMDVLYQAYFVAFLVLLTINAPYNPGNPYNASRTENGFGTFGLPDMAATLAEVATRALAVVWYQKWFIHLRPRPEAAGGLVHLIKSGQANKTDATFSDVILNSQGLQQSYAKYGTWLLSQAFPEGSPMHPAYPTGHGTVAGACITVLKFFFDGTFVIPNPVVSTPDGLSLEPYTGPGVNQLTVNGELNKLGQNVSFGHGIHAGIHWRSDTDTSLQLGEAVALSMLKDRAVTYNEPFTVTLTKLDGTTASISNQ
jgi:hypothetical protein